MCRERYRFGEKAYLSPAPQAEPQAAGFVSGLSPAPQAEPQDAAFTSGLSPAPQAEPQDAAFASGLSPAPQAEPQEEAAAFFLFQPNRFESAIVLTSILIFSKDLSLAVYIIIIIFSPISSTHFFVTVCF
jgi:hypothetical protein